MKLAVVGLGIMGTAIAKSLLAAGHSVTVSNRTLDKAQALKDSGAHVASTPAEAARGAEVVISIVTDPDAVRTVALGENGIAQGLGADAVHAEMSTLTPQAAKEIEAEYASAGKRYVQAPVVGSRTQIEHGALLILAGGAIADVDKCRLAWEPFAKRVWTLENAEQAAAMKLSCNVMIALMITALGESVTFARKFGIPTQDLLDVLDNSALAAPMFRAKGKNLVTGDYSASFTVANLLKDVRQFSEAAGAAGMDKGRNALELSARVLLSQAAEAGLSDDDYSAVVKAMADKAGVTLEG